MNALKTILRCTAKLKKTAVRVGNVFVKIVKYLVIIVLEFHLIKLAFPAKLILT